MFFFFCIYSIFLLCIQCFHVTTPEKPGGVEICDFFFFFFLFFFFSSTLLWNLLTLVCLKETNRARERILKRKLAAEQSEKKEVETTAPAASKWDQAPAGFEGMTVGEVAAHAPKLLALPITNSVVNPNQLRQARRLYVGNIPHKALNEESIVKASQVVALTFFFFFFIFSRAVFQYSNDQCGQNWTGKQSAHNWCADQL
jgi:hypothetical protein